MKLGLNLGPVDPGRLDLDLVQRAKTLGYGSVWTAESYGADAVVPAAWLSAQTTTIGVGNRGHADVGSRANSQR